MARSRLRLRAHQANCRSNSDGIWKWGSPDVILQTTSPMAEWRHMPHKKHIILTFDLAFTYFLVTSVNILCECWRGVLVFLIPKTFYSLPFSSLVIFKSHTGWIPTDDWLIDWFANFIYSFFIYKICTSKQIVFGFLILNVVEVDGLFNLMSIRYIR